MTALTLGAVIFANAQTELTFKPFKVDIALGYALPSGSGSKAGLLVAVEPKYALNDNLTLGLRMETAVTAQGSVVNDELKEGEVKASGSYLATADYYFNTNRFRPFVGGGAGLYTNASADLDEDVTAEDVKKQGNLVLHREQVLSTDISVPLLNTILQANQAASIITILESN